MKKIFTLLFTICSFYLFAQFEDGSFIHDGIQREYTVYLPDNYEPGVQWPLVFNLHGYGSNAGQQSFYTNFTAVADTANFILCEPDGTANSIGGGNGWNVGFPFATNTADDVSFLSDLIDTLHAHYNINLGRVYSCGLSNGGYMSYQLACELTDKIQAVASVAGTFVPDVLDDCMPSSTIPVMHIHGTSDPTVAYSGSPFAIPAEELVSYWVTHNDCANEPDTVFVTESAANDQSSAQLISYTACDTDREVLFYKIIGGEHTWPGAGFPIGVTNQDINASVEIWRFFNRYGEDIPVSTKQLEPGSTITLQPNPVSTQLTLNTQGILILNLRLLNSIGQVVFEQNELNADRFIINMSSFPTGNYFLEMVTYKGIETRQVIKQ